MSDFDVVWFIARPLLLALLVVTSVHLAGTVVERPVISRHSRVALIAWVAGWSSYLILLVLARTGTAVIGPVFIAVVYLSVPTAIGFAFMGLRDVRKAASPPQTLVASICLCAVIIGAPVLVA